MLLCIFGANLLVGICIGLTGIGFMLPMFYLLAVHMTTFEAMAFSFCAFLVSGMLSTVAFYRKNAVDFRIGTWISVGSVIGTMAGVTVNLLLPPSTVKTILYSTVLLSGISIFLPQKANRDTHVGFLGTWSISHVVICIAIGVVTGCICSAAGAGGPILVIPILSILGMPIHKVIGTAMYNSIFLSLFAFPRYFLAAGGTEMVYFAWIPVLLILFGAGVLIGSRYAFRMNQTKLKRTIAVLCVGIAVWKLIGHG